MNLVQAENRMLQKELDELEKEREDIEKYQQKMQGRHEGDLGKINEASKQIREYKLKYKELNK